MAASSAAAHSLREALRVVRDWQGALRDEKANPRLGRIDCVAGLPADWTAELNDPSCTELDRPPTPLEFAKFVGANRPFVVRGYARTVGLPAYERWSPEYLCAKLGDAVLTVAVTPNGRADAIVGERFVEPCEERMTMRRLLDSLGAASGDVPYLSSQCSNLTGELSCLRDDVGDAIPFAREVLPRPDAVNVWIGDERSVRRTRRLPR